MHDLKTLRGALLLAAASGLAALATAVGAAEDPAPPPAAPAAPPAPAAVESKLPDAAWPAVVARDEARVRAGPSANYRVLDKLPRGTMVVVTGTEADFHRVRIPGGVPIYVHTELVELKDGVRGTVSRSDVLMRSTPGQEYFPLEGQKLQKGEAVVVLEKGLGEKGAWLKVLPPDGVEYFVHSSLLERAGAEAGKDKELARLAAKRRDAYTGGKEAAAAKEAAKKAESDFKAMVEAAEASVAATAVGTLPEDADKHRENLRQVMTESDDPALRGRAAALSEEFLGRERVVLYARAKSDRTTVQEELRRKLEDIEAQYRRKLDEVLKAAPKNQGPRWASIGTVKRTLSGYELVKGAVRLHTIDSLRYNLDEYVNLRIGVNGVRVAVDPAAGLSIFRVDSIEILE